MKAANPSPLITREWVARSRAAQGLPATVENTGILAAVASLLSSREQAPREEGRAGEESVSEGGTG